ncbi:alpha/beta hydrolase [Gordonia sp. (in: high G+C Gram-positive bacteria)]|uniref:alpha/beta hydrolase n=1 Tax=Gordonia sp. (in: high G+C Gram-positive bacteria) TaxID=84139 RepID=UPI003C759155
MVVVTIAKNPQWHPDEFLENFQSRTLDLHDDPDGAGPIDATLVRAQGASDAQNGAVLYVHGFTDYFFQTHLADYFREQGYAFYALDLRKCGRSLDDHHQPHYVSDLKIYDEELNAALDIIVEETSAPNAPAQVMVVAHSTGGLITPLWMDRLRKTDPARHRHFKGLLLNSPWLDLQGEALLRSSAVGIAIKGLSKVQAKKEMSRALSSAYGDSLHVSKHGEWSYDLRRKPLVGFPVTFGWLAAVRAGHKRLHRGIDVGVPALVLRSDKTQFQTTYGAEVDTADCVLDVKQIAQWSGAIGKRVWAVAVPGARHDVFLSLEPARSTAFSEVQTWLSTVFGEGAQQ